MDEGKQVKPFVRDVGVNVIANLIAAGIIYLVAAAAGLLPRNLTALLAATIFVILIPGLLLAMAGKMASDRLPNSHQEPLWLMRTGGLGLMGVGFILAALIPDQLSPFYRISFGAMGAIVCITMSIMWRAIKQTRGFTKFSLSEDSNPQIQLEIRSVRRAARIYLAGTVVSCTYAAFAIIVAIVSPSTGTFIAVGVGTVLAFLMVMACRESRPQLRGIVTKLAAELDAAEHGEQTTAGGGS